METVFASVNEEIEKFLSNFSDAHRLYARNFHNVQPNSKIQHHLVRLGRALKTFERPGSGSDEVLHKKAIERWMAADESIAHITKPFLIKESFKDIRLIRMKHIIAGWMKDFELLIEDAWPGPGETYASSGGETSEYDKFLRTDRWTVTKPCFPFFVSAVEANRPLRRWVIEEARRQNPMIPHNDFSVVRALELLTDVVLGARITTVPKNNEKRRPINIEPLGNSMVQKAIGKAFMRVLKKVGNDLMVLQNTHRERLADDSISTIDLSDASDRISVELVDFLFPQGISDLLHKARSRCTEVNGVYIRTNKISCQGNGFTFPLMTIILLAACKACRDDNASVFGDDIICQNTTSVGLIELIEKIGFKVNKEKSFVNSRLRESCGGFWDQGYICCFDLSWITNPPELCATLNKISMYSRSGGIDAPLWSELHARLLPLVPQRYKGPTPVKERDNLDLYVWAEESDVAYLKTGACHWLDKRFQRVTGSITCVATHRPEFAAVEDEHPNGDRFRRLVGSALRLRGGAPVNRNRRGSIRWRECKLFVDAHGALMLEKQYQYLRNGERVYLQSIFESDNVSKDMWDAYTASSSFDRFLQDRNTVLGKCYL